MRDEMSSKLSMSAKVLKHCVSCSARYGCNMLQLMVALATMSDSEVTSTSEMTARAKAALGGPSALAAALSQSGERISSQAVSKWFRVPAERVLEVERLTGVSRYELRPDVYGDSPSSSDTGAAA